MMEEREMPMLTTLLSITVQSIILTCFVSRLVVSPILSNSYAHASLKTRITMIPIATLWLWTSFVGSWLFVVAVNVLQHGTSLNKSAPCTASIFVCISLYCVSKAAIYMFLVERAHIVRGGRRRDDKLYWFNLALVLGIVVLWILCHIFRVARLEKGRCIISIAREVDIPFIIYDFFINIFLTLQFLTPVLNSTSVQARIRQFRQAFSKKHLPSDKTTVQDFQIASEALQQLTTLARRTFIGGLFCTLVTIANGIQVALMFGKEEAWICLATCSGDVVLNCIILHFITNGRHGTDESVQSAASNLSPTRPMMIQQDSHDSMAKIKTQNVSSSVHVDIQEHLTSSSESFDFAIV